MIDDEADFVLVPRSVTFVTSRTVRYRRPGGYLYRIFAALLGEYEMEETTVVVTEEAFVTPLAIGSLSDAVNASFCLSIKDEEVEAELRELLAC